MKKVLILAILLTVLIIAPISVSATTITEKATITPTKAPLLQNNPINQLGIHTKLKYLYKQIKPYISSIEVLKSKKFVITI